MRYIMPPPYTMCRTVILCAMLLGSPLHAGPDASPIPLNLRLYNGTALSVSVKEGRLVIDTAAGELRYPLRDIASMTRQGIGDLVLVTTTSGDHIAGELLALELDPVEASELPEDREAFIQALQRLSNMDIHRAPYRHHRARVLLPGGKRIHIGNGDQLHVVTESSGVRQSVHLPAARVINFQQPTTEEEPWNATISFTGGQIYRGELISPSKRLAFDDLHGNRISLPLGLITGIIGSPSTETTVTLSWELPKAVLTLQEKEQNEQTLHISLPPCSWEIPMAAGTLAVPAALTRSLIRTDDRSGTYRLHTLYGETVSGSLHRADIHSDTIGGPLSFSSTDILTYEWSMPQLPLPEGWLLFALSDGSTIAGQFTEDQALFRDAPEAFRPDRLSAIRPDSGKALFVQLQDDSLTLQPRHSKAEIIALSSGNRTSFRWKDLLACASSFEQLATLLESRDADPGNAPPLQPTETVTVIEPPHAPIPVTPLAPDPTPEPPPTPPVLPPAADTPPERPEEAPVLTEAPPELSVRTLAGELSLTPDAVQSILVLDSRQALLNLKHGTTLLAQTRAKDAIETWAEAAGARKTTDPESRTRWSLSGAVSTPPAPTCAVRLDTGEQVVGSLAALSIEPTGRRTRDAITMEPAEFLACQRDANGKLLLTSTTRTHHLQAPSGYADIDLMETATPTRLRIPLNHLVFGHADASPTLPFATSAGTTHHVPELAGMVHVPGGSFQMGSSPNEGMADERPAHTVELPDFWMDTTEVTRTLFGAFVRDTGYQTIAERMRAPETWQDPGISQQPSHPVVAVAWLDAVAFCNWRSQLAGLQPCYRITPREPVELIRHATGFRLPSEAEWEYAARSAGKDQPFPWLDTTAAHAANVSPDSHDPQLHSPRSTTPVTQFPQTPLGLFGLGGNVWEWCEDTYSPLAYAAPARPTRAPIHLADWQDLSTHRVMRGGSYQNTLDYLRTRGRGHGLPFASNNRTGFRCVLSCVTE